MCEVEKNSGGGYYPKILKKSEIETLRELIELSFDENFAEALIERRCEVESNDYQNKYNILKQCFADADIIATLGDDDYKTDFHALLSVIISSNWG